MDSGSTKVRAVCFVFFLSARWSVSYQRASTLKLQENRILDSFRIPWVCLTGLTGFVLDSVHDFCCVFTVRCISEAAATKQGLHGLRGVGLRGAAGKRDDGFLLTVSLFQSESAEDTLYFQENLWFTWESSTECHLARRGSYAIISFFPVMHQPAVSLPFKVAPNDKNTEMWTGVLKMPQNWEWKQRGQRTRLDSPTHLEFTFIMCLLFQIISCEILGIFSILLVGGKKLCARNVHIRNIPSDCKCTSFIIWNLETKRNT